MGMRWLTAWLALTPRVVMGGLEELTDEERIDLEKPPEPPSLDQLSRLHGRWDGDGDGRVSVSEIMAHSREVHIAMSRKGIDEYVGQLDESGDNHVSLEEHLNDIRKELAATNEREQQELDERLVIEAEKFTAADENGDGKLTGHELAALFFPEHHDHVLDVTTRQFVKRKDKDGDGKLNLIEFWKLHDGHEISKGEKDVFAKLDKDSDGKLNVEEIKPWESGRYHTEETMHKLIRDSDKDEDGHLSADELQSFQGQMVDHDAHYHIEQWVTHHEL